jgi:hypothetical protein
VPAKKNKGVKIIEEGSSPAAQEEEEGAFQANVPPYGGILMPPRHFEGVPMQAWGSGAAMPPPLRPTVPNVAFAEPYAHLQFLSHNKVWSLLGDTLQGICKVLQSSNPMKIKREKGPQISPMS